MMSAGIKSAANPIEILVVEDSSTQGEELRFLLEQHGYSVALAKHGADALAFIGKRKPNVVISDINMPEMNGYELCKQLKADKSTREIPVILLTSLTDPEDVLEGLACGADSFITKPYKADYLLAYIQQLLASWKLRNNETIRVGVEILFAGKRRFISADQQQVLGLLLSTYEAAVQRNNELLQTQQELTSLNEQLEDKVLERTALLSAENAERKRTEEELRKLQMKHEEALRIARMGYWEFDLSTAQFTFNDQYLTLHGTTVEEAGGYQMSMEKFASQYIHPDEVNMLMEAVRNAKESKDPNYRFRTDTRILRQDGEERVVSVWFSVEANSQGRIIKLIGVKSGYH